MMKRYLFFACLWLATAQCAAQNVEQLVKAERDFAAYAKDVNTRDAFLKFMDVQGVVFNNGLPQNAINVWTKNPIDKTKLLWEPAFAGIASSGDLGYTTGPWEFKKTLADTALASGVFTSVWRKNDAGEWKNIVDMGYALPKPAPLVVPQITISQQIKPAFHQKKADPLLLDMELIFLYNKQGSSAFNTFLTDDSWLNMNALPPFTKVDDHARALAAIPAGIVMKPLGSGVSRSGDLAYVYGSVTYQKDKQNYLRVWKQTPAGWKIILQVLLW